MQQSASSQVRWWLDRAGWMARALVVTTIVTAPGPVQATMDPAGHGRTGSRPRGSKKPLLVRQRLAAELELRRLFPSARARAEAVGALELLGVSSYKRQEQQLLAEAIAPHVALFGKDGRGQWRRNYVPPECVGPQSGSCASVGRYHHSGHLFDTLRSRALSHVSGFDVYGCLGLDRAGGIQLAPDLSKNPGLWADLVFGALSHAGPEVGHLLRLGLVERPRRRNVKRFLDLEWRPKLEAHSGRSTYEAVAVAAEANTRGTVSTAAQLASWMRHVLLATGLKTREEMRQLTDADEVFRLMPAHLNVSIDHRDLEVLPPATRQRFHQSQVGLWGTASDAYPVEIVAASVPRPGRDGRVELFEADVTADGAMLPRVDQGRHNASIRPLPRSVYETHLATESGILAPRPYDDYDSQTDPCFGAAGKSRAMGLRSYLPGAPVEGQPALARLEVRAAPTLLDAFSMIPAAVPGHPEWVDLEPLLARHGHQGPRGLLASRAELTARAGVLGQGEGQVARLQRFVAEIPLHLAGDGSSWGTDEGAAMYLLPCTDWLNHAHVAQQVARHTASERGRMTARFQAAQERYVARLDSLADAFFNEGVAYKPDWADASSEREYAVYNGWAMGTPPYRQQTRLVRLILLSEAGRFAVESGLADLMAMWGIHNTR